MGYLVGEDVTRTVGGTVGDAVGLLLGRPDGKVVGGTRGPRERKAVIGMPLGLVEDGLTAS